MRKGMRYVFPDHWSFLLGEIALYSLHRADRNRHLSWRCSSSPAPRGPSITVPTRPLDGQTR